jgi:sec-independent protein translocase protein TatB
MFGIDSTELLVVAVVALVVIGPKDLPRVMRTVGQWVGRARGMARHFRSGIDTMIREAELEEMEKKWKEENERIMREYPILPAAEPAELPAPAGSGEATDAAIADAPEAPPPPKPAEDLP